MVKNVSEAMMSSLPSFWRISKDFMEGKFKKVRSIYVVSAFTQQNSQQPLTSSSGGRRSASQCRTMALDVVKLYISLISEFFILSDMTVMASPKSKVPPLLPAKSHSMSTAYYLLKMLNDIQETVNELNLMEISSETSSSLKNFLESAKWRFEDVLVVAWLRGKSFF